MGADELIPLGTWRLDLAGRRLIGERRVILLSALEARLLEHLGRRPGEVQSPEALLTAVWGYRPGVRSKAVALTISRLRRKVGDEGPPLVETALGGGYRVPDPHADEPSLEHLDRLRAELGRRGGALAELEELQPRVQRALERPRPLDEQARLWLARAVWACQRQIHLPAVPLWVLAEGLPPGQLATTAALWAARLVGVGGSSTAALSALLPWLDRCPADPSGRCLRGELLLTLGNQGLRLGRLEDARRWAEEALSIGDRLGDTALGANALGLLGRVEFQEGRREAGRQRLQDAVALLSASGEVATAARLEQNLGTQLYALGALDAAEAALERAARTLDALGLSLDAGMARVNLGTVYLAHAAPERALEVARAALALFTEAVDHGGEVIARLVEGRALAVLGRIDEARRALERDVWLARRLGNRRYEGHALRYLCWVQRVSGDPEAARATGQEAVPLLAQEVDALRTLQIWSGDPPTGEAAPQPGRQSAPGPGWVDAELSRRLWQRASLAQGA